MAWKIQYFFRFSVLLILYIYIFHSQLYYATLAVIFTRYMYIAIYEYIIIFLLKIADSASVITKSIYTIFTNDKRKLCSITYIESIVCQHSFQYIYSLCVKFYYFSHWTEFIEYSWICDMKLEHWMLMKHFSHSIMNVMNIP